MLFKKKLCLLFVLPSMFLSSNFNSSNNCIHNSKNNILYSETIDVDFDGVIKEFETAETPKEIIKNIDNIKTAILEETKEPNSYIIYALNTLEKAAADIDKKTELSEDYFQTIFSNVLSEVSSSENASKLRSAGVDAFAIKWNKKKFLWFTINLPVGFIIKLSASTCRTIISSGFTLASEVIISAFEACHLGVVIGTAISLLAGVTGNPILVAATAIISTLSSGAIISLLVKHLLSFTFGEAVDKILKENIKDGIIIQTEGTNLITFLLQ